MVVKKTLNLILLLLLMQNLTGCGTSSKPADFPKVYPTKITVVDGGTPMDNVAIAIALESGGGSIGIGGNTDQNGVLEIVTSQASYQEKGCPAGKYKVTLNKRPKLPGELPQEEINKMTPEETNVYAAKIDKELKAAKPVIPVKLTLLSSTPILLDVTETGAELKIDIAEYK